MPSRGGWATVHHGETRKPLGQKSRPIRSPLLGDGAHRIAVLQEMIEVAIDQHVAHVRPRRDGAEPKSARQVGRKILETVDCEIGFLPKQRFLEFLRE